jgi:hypothetical protein
MKALAWVLYILTSVSYVEVVDLQSAFMGVPAEYVGYGVLVGLPLSFILAVAAASMEGTLCRVGKGAWAWVITNGGVLLALKIPEFANIVYDFAPFAPWLIWITATSAFALVAYSRS